METLIKVGTLAKETGLTVRALHYYEEVGLLKPAKRSEKGYRLYGIGEVQRLQKIVSLQQLGFTLEDIRRMLDDEAYSLSDVLTMHIAQLEEQLTAQQSLMEQLKKISSYIEHARDISISDFIHTIKEIKMHEKYYTPEQLATLKKRGEAMGEAGIQQGQNDWVALNNAFKTEMEKGTDPADERVQALVAKMQELINAFTGGDPAIEKSLSKMYKEEGPENASRGMMDQALFEYVGKARAASGNGKENK